MSHFPFFVSYLFCHLFFSLTGDIMLSLILLMIAAAVLLTACSPADTSADIYVYDYGQNENYYGDCVLLKSGHKAILMDMSLSCIYLIIIMTTPETRQSL